MDGQSAKRFERTPARSQARAEQRSLEKCSHGDRPTTGIRSENVSKHVLWDTWDRRVSLSLSPGPICAGRGLSIYLFTSRHMGQTRESESVSRPHLCWPWTIYLSIYLETHGTDAWVWVCLQAPSVLAVDYLSIYLPRDKWDRRVSLSLSPGPICAGLGLSIYLSIYLPRDTWDRRVSLSLSPGPICAGRGLSIYLSIYLFTSRHMGQTREPESVYRPHLCWPWTIYLSIYLETHGTDAWAWVCLQAPSVLAVYVATVDVDVGLLLRLYPPVLTRQHQRG